MAYFRCTGGGGGSQPVLITKNITQNGTYNASADSADGYSQVKVEVSGGGANLGEKTINTYGVFNASDDSLDGYSKVTNVTGLETATASGAVASISDAVAMPCPSVVADIDYTAQGVTGASVAKSGNNLLPTDFGSGNDVNGISWTTQNGVVTVNGTSSAVVTIDASLGDFKWDGVTPCWVSGLTRQGSSTTFSLRVDGETESDYSDPIYRATGYVLNQFHGNIINKRLHLRIIIRSGQTFVNEKFYPMLNYGTSALPFEEYRGYTKYTATFGRTIYGGNYDFISGILTEDTDSNGDPISPPNVYNLTPQAITTAQGVNNFYADTGDTSASYYREKPPYERLFYFEGVQSDAVQIPPATSLDEDTNFSTYLSYDTTTKKFTVLKAFSAMVTGWVYQFQNASSYGTGQFVVNDSARMNYQVPNTSAGSKDGDTGVFDFAVGDTFWAYQNSGNGWPQQFLKVYLIKNIGISGVVEWDDETA